MNTEIFNIGDVVCLRSHAYLKNVTNIVISGEQQLIPPLMVISEVFKITTDSVQYEYNCIWFSSKSHSFENARVKDIHLRKVIENKEITLREEVFPGIMVTLKSMDYELHKKKSSFTFEDTSLNSGSDNITISALLTNLPPILHVLNVKEHKTKYPIRKGDDQICWVPTWDIKCFWYNANGERLSEVVLPLEVLRIIDPVNEELIISLDKIIEKSGTVKINIKDSTFLIKPRFITFRSGYYFLRGYDYVLNRITENKISTTTEFTETETYILNSAPSFDIENNPKAATKESAIEEIIEKVNEAAGNNNFIRIKYKSRNDVISLRTIKNFKIVHGKEEEKDYSYLIGFCCLRSAERVFRIDRIESFEELNLKFKSIKPYTNASL